MPVFMYAQCLLRLLCQCLFMPSVYLYLTLLKVLCQHCFRGITKRRTALENGMENETENGKVVLNPY